MNEIGVTILITLLASSGFWTCINMLMVNSIKKQQKKSVNYKALLALLHDRLYYLLEKYIKEGAISSDEYDNIMYLYTPYKEMGGNGTCERLMKELDAIPIDRHRKGETENAK